MKRCPIKGRFEVCEVEKIGGARYVKVRAAPARKKVRASASSSAALKLSLIRRIKEHEAKGIDYAALNDYFLAEFKAMGDRNPMGVGFLKDILTYDPRADPPKTYTGVLSGLQQAPSSLDWTVMSGVIQGLQYGAI